MRYAYARVSCLAFAMVLGAAVAARADLVAHFPFDGSTADATGNGNDGTFFGDAVPNYVAGHDGADPGAIAFDGTDDYVSVLQNDRLPITDSAAFTVAMWVNGAVQSDRRVFSEGSSTSGNPLFNLGTHNSGANGTLNSFLRPGPGHRQTAGTTYDGEWHHIAWVDDDGQVTVYIDGLRDTANLSYTRQLSGLDRTSIGGILRSGPCCYFNGAIDDVRLYDHALSEADVRGLIPTPGCPEEGDTVCDSLAVIDSPVGGLAGWYTLEATATDGDGDDPLIYEFEVFDADGNSLRYSGRTNSDTLTLVLGTGTWTVRCRVDDDDACFDEAAGAVRETEVVVDPEPICVSHWAYDGDLLDSGPGGNHGTFFGDVAPTFVAGFDGTPNGAVEFDGVDDYVSFTQSNGLPIYANSSYTVSMWVRGAAGQTDLRVFSEASTTNVNPLLNIGTDNAGVNAQLDIFVRMGPTLVSHAHSARDAFDGEWHHIAWVDDNGQGKMYIDGVRDATMPSYTRVPVIDLDTTTSGGILRASPSHFFAGAIDDVRVCNYALDGDAIRAMVPEAAGCAADFDTSCAGLVEEAPPGRVAGNWTFTLTGADTSGDSPLVHTFELFDSEGALLQQIGPQESNQATFNLTAGDFTVVGTVDDFLLCYDDGDSTQCSIDVSALETPLYSSRWAFDGDLLDSGQILGSEDSPGNDGAWNGDNDPVFVQGYDCTDGGALVFGGDGAGTTNDDLVIVTQNIGLPLYASEAFSIAMWVNGPPQADKRIWSEGSTQSNTPLFNLGTDNTGATGALDFYLRAEAADGGTIAEHVKSTQTVLDDTWHHFCWVDVAGDVTLYVDGVEDATDFDYVRPPLVLDTTTIGGILRATPCCEFQGAIDDVRIFNYELTPAEVTAIFGDGPGDCCPDEGDTHCQGLAISGPADNGPGIYTATATAMDESEDAVIYTFRAQEEGGGDPIILGPQDAASADFDLPAGNWAISVIVDDDPDCDDAAGDNSCSQEISVLPPVGPFARGDSDANGTREITDSVVIFGFLFLGDPPPDCMAAADTNLQGELNLTSGVYLLSFLFLGGPAPPDPFECARSTVASDVALGCDSPCAPVP